MPRQLNRYGRLSLRMREAGCGVSANVPAQYTENMWQRYEARHLTSLPYVVKYGAPTYARRIIFAAMFHMADCIAQQAQAYVLTYRGECSEHTARSRLAPFAELFGIMREYQRTGVLDIAAARHKWDCIWSGGATDFGRPLRTMLESANRVIEAAIAEASGRALSQGWTDALYYGFHAWNAMLGGRVTITLQHGQELLDAIRSAVPENIFAAVESEASTCEVCGSTGENCDCVRCNGCVRWHRASTMCGDCRYCSGCCGCPRCNECRTRIHTSQGERQCRHCLQGIECCPCTCEERRARQPHVVEASGAIHYAKHPSSRKRFACHRLAGVEVEFNNCADFRPVKAWAEKWGAGVHHDGSCGWEAVTSPAAGDKLLAQLGELFEALRQAGAVADSRCGIHVHVDARDLQWSGLENLVTVYSKCEGLLYLLAGQNRANNTYCVPSGRSFAEAMQRTQAQGKEAVRGAILGVIYGVVDGKRYRRENKPHKKDGNRYKGLNLCPWVAGRYTRPVRPDTTIEFRLHRNSLDGERVAEWVKLLTKVVDYCAGAPSKAVAELPRKASDALRKIAPESVPYLVARIKAWRRSVRLRYRRVKYSPTRGYLLTSPRVNAGAAQELPDAA